MLTCCIKQFTCKHVVMEMCSDGGGGIDGLDAVTSSRIVGTLDFIKFPTPHKIQNDDRPPDTEIDDLRCEWVNVSSGTSQPGLSRTNGCKTAVVIVEYIVSSQ